MSRLAIFRCDASPEIGTGHVMRCLTLAGTLSERGWRCQLAGKPGTFAALSGRLPAGIEALELGEGSPGELQALAPDGCDVAVVDHYGLDARYEAALRPWASRLLAIDDLANRPHDCDLLLDTVLGRSASDYRPLTGDDTRLLLGPAYAPLRPAFAAARPPALERRRLATGAVRILVALGGLPRSEHLELLLTAVTGAAPGAEIEVVASSTAASPLAERFTGLHWRHDVEDMAGLMADCDISAGAGGMTAWERCSLGLPSVLLEVADNQRLVCRSLDAAGAAVSAGPIAAPGAGERVSAAMKRLASEAGARAEMSRRAALVCDGLGARRVAAALEPELARDGAAVLLRPVEAGDCDRILAWQREPDARRYARNPQPPSRQEHQAWFEKRCSDPRQGPFEVILHRDRPVGFVRLDRLDPDTPRLTPAPPPEENASYLISILVSHQAAGRGVGSAALALVTRLMEGRTIYAEVLEGNYSSHALFRKSGYEAIGPSLYRRPLGSEPRRV